jgi:hypothetical protein
MDRYRKSLVSAAFIGTTSAFADGGGTARVQVIRNCADAAASSVDVWLDNTLLLDNFAFRTASPFIDAPATIDFTVGIALPNSTSSADGLSPRRSTWLKTAAISWLRTAP